MAYIEVDIIIPAMLESGREITIAELGAAAYESFLDTESGLKAYIREEDFDPVFLDSLTIVRSGEFGQCKLSVNTIEETNWNAKWESDYEAVSIPGFCYIRSPFHPQSAEHRYEVIIEPKMSFGTGHHETTWLMVDMMKSLDFNGKRVLDVGCGTGVLSILSSLLGSVKVSGIDIDEWAYNNSIENIGINRIENCTILHGDIDLIKGEIFDIILANISRNINISYMSTYKELCPGGGYLIVSGFYSEDIDKVKEEAALSGFSYLEHKTKNNWASVIFISQK